MRQFFNVLTIISGVIMTITILIQSKGSGLSTTFGGDGGSFKVKRGAEKVVFNVTILMAVVFALSVVLGLLSRA